MLSVEVGGRAEDCVDAGREGWELVRGDTGQGSAMVIVLYGDRLVVRGRSIGQLG